VLNIPGKPIHDRFAHPSRLLPLDDRTANVPVQIDQLAINGQGRLHLGGADPSLEIVQQTRIVVRQARGRYRCSARNQASSADPTRRLL